MTRGAAEIQEQAGAQIGRYKLLEQIGEGGMGTIWMAEQREPVRRRVALKIIKLGMDTKQVIARFEAERQALAMMDHPHIAKVLDAGATETGRPYFVMEYIKGIPILEYCDREKLDTQARLQLFTSVCHAIQHAHQKGIIHRDIKPSNVLVTLHDGVPVPKVIDFGIAKATNSELTAKTLFTEHRQMIGTPAYMSPEQAEMSGLDIDTRSDIYSLGVLLYELLTGTTPFDMKALLESGFNEMMRTIREDEPHKPSTRISSLGDTGTRTAQQRRIDSKKLSVLLRGDLDWIVMKCLEKDRSRRYDTANGLAADIVRHLRDEPVTAGAPSSGYRLRKFVKRNRAQVVAGGVVATVLVLGVIGTTGGMLWANQERDRAEHERTRATLAADSEAQAKLEAQENERLAIAEQERAEAAREEEAGARKRAETISEFVITALKSSDAENEGGSQGMTILAAMDNALADIEAGRFAHDPRTEAELKSTIGEILKNNGRLQEAEPLIAEAVELHVRYHPEDCAYLARLLGELAIIRRSLGRPSEAEPLVVQALEMYRRLDPDDIESATAEMNNLALVREEQGRLQEAEALLVEVIELRERTHPGDEPNLAKALDNLGKVLLRSMRPAAADALLERALEMRKRLYAGDHPDLALGMNNLAGSRSALGRYAEAEALQVQALEMNQRLFAGDHPSVAQLLTNLAATLRDRKRSAEAEPLARRGLEMNQRLFPGDHTQVVVSLHVLASVLWELNRREESEPVFVAALEMNRRQLPPGHEELISSIFVVGRMFWWLRKLDQSIPLLEEALRDQEAKHGKEDPRTIEMMAYLGANYRAAERYAEALPLLEEGFRASKTRPTLKFTAQHLLDSYFALGEAVVSDRAATVENLVPDMLAEARGRDAEGSAELGDSLAECSTILLWLKDWAGAELLLVECSKIRESVAPDDWRTFNTKSQLGGALLGQGKLAEAEPWLLAGYRGMKQREASIPPPGATRIPEALERLVRLYEALGNASEAAAWRSQLEAARKR